MDKIISEVGLSEIYCCVMLPNSWINVVNDLRYANDTIVVANTTKYLNHKKPNYLTLLKVNWFVVNRVPTI